MEIFLILLRYQVNIMVWDNLNSFHPDTNSYYNNKESERMVQLISSSTKQLIMISFKFLLGNINLAVQRSTTLLHF